MPSKYEKEIEDILRGAERRAEADDNWQKRDRERWKQRRPARRWRIRGAYDTSTILLFSGVGLIVLAFIVNFQLHFAATIMAIAGVILFLSPIFLSIKQATSGNPKYWRGQPVRRRPIAGRWQWWRTLQSDFRRWLGKGPR
ncbi:MAG: hypothetical protein M1319_05155 [Chloroflexi bacterium]|nr:hypothetical protein [Chloroflexota bacterium]